MMNDSYMPPQVYELTKSRGAAMSYMTVPRIETFLEPIRTKIVEDTKFRNHFERKAQYEKVTETLPPELCDVELGVSSAYISAYAAARDNIVEILDANKSRAAYGTIVSHDGLIVTLASRVKDYPVCRMPDNNLTTAAVIGKDEEDGPGSAEG